MSEADWMIKSFLYCFIFTVILGLPAAFFTKSIWAVYLDQTPPQIQMLSDTERIGIGSAGGKFEIAVSDLEPGIDEVIVRLRQLRSDYELFRKKLGGTKEAKLSIDLGSQSGGIGEGDGEVEIVAFDRSFYNNRGSIVAKAFVDTRPPGLDVISTQHNLRQGGAQLVLYTAHDENLTFSGVRVGTKLFEGFPAGQLDSALNRNGLYAAFYTVPIDLETKDSVKSKQLTKPEDIKLSAVDIGGNAVEQSFYNKVFRRTARNVSSTNMRLISWLAGFPADVDKPTDNLENSGSSPLIPAGSHKKEAAIDAATLVQGFMKVPGTVLLAYGDRIKLPQKSGLETGSLFIFTGIGEAKALHSGEVSLVKELESSAYEVHIMHGLGLSSLYKGLKSVAVRAGQQVQAGELLGAVDSYLAIGAEISGQRVDPTEWWSEDWTSAHIFEKIQEAKRSLGIVVE